MNKNKFTQTGYKEFPVGGLEEGWACLFLQKRVQDEQGTKYFINVYFPKPFPDHLAVLNDKPTARAQFDVGQATVNLEYFHIDSLEIMEAFFEKAWHDMGASYRD